MRRALVTVVLPIAWVAATLGQNNVGGTWRVEGQPSMPWTFVLNVSGDAVSGTAAMAGAAPSPIFDGRTDGRSVVFRARSGDGDRTVTFSGTLDADAMTFTRDVQVREGGSPGGNGLFGAAAPTRFVAQRISGTVITPALTEPDLERRDRPVTSDDLKIVTRARSLLADGRSWNRQDDRECADDETRAERSLFCALQKATIEVLGEYDHRRVALQEVRFAVEDATRGQQFEHRIMDFNNLPTTTLNDIWRVLDVALERMRARLPTR